ncbi:MAG: hypothetical protein ACKOT0_13590 [bacterium]
MPAHPALPERPWLRDDVPWAWRDDDTLQVGDGDRLLLLPAVSPAAADWLASLRGERSLAAVIAAARRAGIPGPLARRLLRALTSTGALDDAAAMPESLRCAHPLIREQLSHDLAAARQVHGSASAAARAIDRRRAASVSVHGTGPTADAVCVILGQAGVGTVLREGPGSSSSRRQRRASAQRSVAVLADAVHPDVVDDLGAISLDLPHLPVLAHGARAVIGPFVVPGLTGCLRCSDLHARDADPAWPRLAVQWASRRPSRSPADSALAQLAASWAALAVLGWIEADGARALQSGTWPRGWPDAGGPLVGGRLVVRLPGGGVNREVRHPHPLCGCRWPSAA